MDRDRDNQTEALEAQLTLVESSLPLVFETYDHAVDSGVVDPVVLIVDCEDELGGQMVRGWLGDEAVDDAIAAQHAEEAEGFETTVFARALPLTECGHELSEAFPYLRPVFEDPPLADGVLVVGVTAEGASALTAPFDAR